jgi:hypothetical protein
MKTILNLIIIPLLLLGCKQQQKPSEEFRQVSGIYPHLAMYNNEGECGTGAVVPWADKLWAVTYAPHEPKGSSNKLYEIDSDLTQNVRKESIGGTPANRMIHKESKQLFIGPHAIDENGTVRTIPYSEMVGRHTGNARHLTSPKDKIYYGTMEEGFYEVDVNNLKVTELYRDGNLTRKHGEMAQAAELLVGAHGKGLYSGQGVMVYSNNGEATPKALTDFDIEAGVLAEWNGKDWKVVRRNQFVEVTGPGGIYGNSNPEADPIWATGWDHKSVILGVRNPETGWDFYRLPKASHTYDGAHGWNTEWPRIRDVGTADNPDYLMTMHGLFWKFPETFTVENSGGIQPRSAYLKVIGDFTRWNDQLVFGCDDSAQKEFLNKRKHKGNIEGPGQSNSNLWFTDFDKPDQLGPNNVSGAVWLNENVKSDIPSEPMLFSGWSNRIAWINNMGNSLVTFEFEIDKQGNGTWESLNSIELGTGESINFQFDSGEKGEWIRVKTNVATTATATFNYSNGDKRSSIVSNIFEGLATVDSDILKGGLLFGLGDDRRSLGISTVKFNNGEKQETGYYELDAELNLVPKNDSETNSFIKEKFAIPKNVIEIKESSVLIIDYKKRRWRLPLGDSKYKELTDNAHLRICREVATERDLFNCHGTFYELPAENADGFAKIRPVASHNYRIHDYASYRGMLVMTGINEEAEQGEHIIKSEDGNAAVWVGVIDDLWEMGKPTGHGGPWKNSKVQADIPSDPYLIGHYDKKTLELSHNLNRTVEFIIEIESIGHGPWMIYKKVTVGADVTFKYEFPRSFQARWIRFVANKDCKATTLLRYN